MINTDSWLSDFLPPDPIEALAARLTAGSSEIYRRPPITPKHPRWHQLPGRPEFDDLSG